jgi:phenylacetate-coenzyme A ligase PaaK-like adenylate-forming protein
MKLSELSDLCTYATAPGRFYRKHFGLPAGGPPITISSWDEWHALPLLSKETLAQTPLQERLFIPLSRVDHFFCSSGTTGRLPVFSSRARLLEYGFRTAWHSFTRPVLVSSPVPHQHEAFLASCDAPPLSITLDPRNPAASARLAKAAGVDAIFAFAFHIPIVMPHLVAAGIAPDIRYIEMTGSACPRAQFEEMRTCFPNAKIMQVYGTSEVENSVMGIPCRPIDDSEPLAVYHPKEGHHLEIYDTETGRPLLPKAGVEGEMIITAFRGEPASFPMIRYRSGDKVRITEERCATHGTWSFTVLGRVDMDFVKIRGGVLKVDELERVLRLLPESTSDVFELHVFEPKDGPLRLVLKVQARDSNLPKLADKVSSMMRVGPSQTHADGVKRGLYAPLVCERLEVVPRGKHKRIVIDKI